MRQPRRLGILASIRGYVDRDGLHLPLSLGRVVDGLAERYERVVLCAPIAREGRIQIADYHLRARDVTLIPAPDYATTLAALKRPLGIAQAYRRLCRAADRLLIRGFCPLTPIAYAAARARRLRVCHWIVANPIELMKSHRRLGCWMDRAALLYARCDRAGIRFGRWWTGGAFVCNGREAADAFPSPRTVAAVSSVVTAEEIHERGDTCLNGVLRMLFIGHIRPEKGIEYLLRAAAGLSVDRPWEMDLVGPVEQFAAYRERLSRLTEELNIADRVRWRGFVPYGPAMFELFRRADVFVLPTLSEGTPRVLVEARANAVPVIASRVGGIPSSVEDGVDGLLVPPKDVAALRDAITRVVRDGELRRSLIRHGLNRVRAMTLERFLDVVEGALEGGGG